MVTFSLLYRFCIDITLAYKSYLLNKLSVLLGRRVAERLVFSDISTGAQNDLKMVTELAEKMVCQWGMSDKLGPITFNRGDEQPFLGMKLAHRKKSFPMRWHGILIRRFRNS